MTNHTDLLNLIAKKIGAQWYTEIGVYNPDHNFDKIKVVHKRGVDPDPNAKASYCCTSDHYFKVLNETGAKNDLVFIDGLHHADQVKKDIENAWDSLHVGGVIVLHDCNPPTEATTCVPRGKQREWCGDVYKTICKLASPLSFFTVDFDYGCTVIRKTDEPLEWVETIKGEDITWETFDKNRKMLLNLTSVEDAVKIIEAWM